MTAKQQTLMDNWTGLCMARVELQTLYARMVKDESVNVAMLVGIHEALKVIDKQADRMIRRCVKAGITI